MADLQESSPEPCGCICHGPRGVVGQGGTWIYDDDRGIRHEDWFDCRCDCAENPA